MSEKKQEALLFICIAVVLALSIFDPLFQFSLGTYSRLEKCTSPEVRLKCGLYIVQFDPSFFPPATVKMFHNGESVILTEVGDGYRRYCFLAPDEDRVTLEWTSSTGVKNSVPIDPIKRSTKLFFIGLLLTTVVIIFYATEYVPALE